MVVGAGTVTTKPFPATLLVMVIAVVVAADELQVVPAIGVDISCWTRIALLAVTAVVDALPVVAPAATTKWPDTAEPRAAGLELEDPTDTVLKSEAVSPS